MRDAFFEKLVEAARLDERIIILSADHSAFALKKFEEEIPDRYINIGIAEQNMVSLLLCAGFTNHSTGIARLLASTHLQDSLRLMHKMVHPT